MKLSRIALVAFGLATILGSGSALAQSRAIAIEPRTEVAAPAPALRPRGRPVAEVKVETPKVEEAKVVETPKVEVEAPKEAPKAAVVVPVKKVVEKKVFVPVEEGLQGPDLPLTRHAHTHELRTQPRSRLGSRFLV